MKSWKTLGLIGLLSSGCITNSGDHWERTKQQRKDYFVAFERVVLVYGDKNDDGRIEEEEISVLVHDIAKANGFKYKRLDNSGLTREWDGFVDAEGRKLTLEQGTKMFNNYKPK